MLGNLKAKIDHKLNALKLYCGSEKLRGYQLQITGDIDEPLGDKTDGSLIGEWLSLANHVGTIKPTLYFTKTGLFEETKNTVLQITSNVNIGVHGLKHVYYSAMGCLELNTDFKAESKFSSNHRFPFLDWNPMALHYASFFFASDSSIVSRWMYPFKINSMMEFPVCPPTDTALRSKPVTDHTVAIYRNLISEAIRHDRPLTLLLHPNVWSVTLLRKLKTS
jgi:hypothetical protein